MSLPLVRSKIFSVVNWELCHLINPYPVSTFQSSSSCLFPDYGYGSDDSKKPSLGYSPDITHNALLSGGTGSSGSSNGAARPQGRPVGGGNLTPTTVCYEYSYPDSNSNHSKSGFVRPLSEHHYEQPMVVFPPSQSPADSIGKPPRSESGGSSASSHERGKLFRASNP